MRLLVVSQYFWPENFRINDLVAEFVRKGHDVTVLTGWPNYPEGKVFDAFRQHPEQYACFEGARIVRVPLLPRGRGAVRLMLNYFSFASVLRCWACGNCAACRLTRCWCMSRHRFRWESPAW